MSDLSATQCGCNNTREGSNGCNTLIWLIILLALFNNNDGCGNNGIGLFNNNSDSGCSSLIWLLLILSCCCNNSF